LYKTSNYILLFRGISGWPNAAVSVQLKRKSIIKFECVVINNIVFCGVLLVLAGHDTRWCGAPDAP